MKVYLDIDDTLLNTRDLYIRPADHIKPFLEYVVNNYDVYWLTTHCNGDASVPVAYLSRFVSSDVVQLIMKIKPTSWKIHKTGAINMDEDFLWFDDTLAWGEEKALQAKNKLSSFVKVDLGKNPSALLGFITPASHS